ncbi:hypothetical protein [Neosynechococcus sphagnicola]|uniref:hypothetical protein n=1 Tax=Neosynechococcus sphagnicola TaxID=1501145 RepID=UPI00055A8FE9|nr:hypothetical protein [Neosynechococcus sphagnicola]
MNLEFWGAIAKFHLPSLNIRLCYATLHEQNSELPPQTLNYRDQKCSRAGQIWSGTGVGCGISRFFSASLHRDWRFWLRVVVALRYITAFHPT